METEKYPKILRSSENSNNMSLTIKGLLVLIASWGFKQAGIDLGEGDLLNFVELLIVAIGSAWTFWGFVRKIINRDRIK